MKTDVELGKKVHEALKAAGIETPMVGNLLTEKQLPKHICAGNLARSFEGILRDLGLDLTDDSLQDTPRRVAEMYVDELFGGLNYSNFPKCTVVENKMKYDELVAVGNITVKSVCEHHLVPIYGEATVGYIPGEHVMGLSKFNRVVNFFCRRPQVQERLTEQIAAALECILGTNDIAVVIKADHFCMKMRGVNEQNAKTTTSKMLGRFRANTALREEFLALTRV